MPSIADPELTRLIAEVRRSNANLIAYLQGERAVEVQTGDGEVWTLEQTAKFLKCSTSTLKKGFAGGRFPFLFRDGKFLKSSSVEARKWVAKRVKRGAATAGAILLFVLVAYPKMPRAPFALGAPIAVCAHVYGYSMLRREDKPSWAA